MPGGRPTKYNKALCKLLPDMFSGGESVAEVCASLEITKDTFYRWVKEHSEFSDAYKKGLTLSEAWWAKLGRDGAQDKDRIQPATWIFNMKNRFKWTDREEHEITAEVKTANPEQIRSAIEEALAKSKNP